MPSRAYWIPALILWFASTGWLLSTKIMPALSAGKPPAYGELLPRTAVTDPEPVRWAIRWDGQEIGWAENKISRSSDGTGQILNEVQFVQLPVEEMLKDVLGVMGSLAAPIVGDIGPLDLSVVTALNFDNYGVLSHFETDVDVGTLKELLRIEGHVRGEKLDLTAHIKSESDRPQQVFRKKEIALPPDALVADTFSPRPKLANIRVGQTWTCLLYTSPSPRDQRGSRMPSSA